MKIVDRAAFLELPAGTLFSKFQPFVFGPLCIKEESLTKDFWYQPLTDSVEAVNTEEFVNTMDNATTHLGTSFNLDLDVLSRDGLFDDHQLFAVWEKFDVTQLIERLQHALLEGYSS